MVADTEASVTAISFASIVDWLVGRGFLKQGWRAQLRVLQDRIAELAKSLPEELQPSHDTVPDFDFAKTVRDKLAETAPRNLLNNLTGDARSWDKVVKTYQAKNLHAGEAALFLVRNGEFEVPHLRSKITRQQQQLSDLVKRQAEHTKSIQNAQADYAKECKAFGIDGDDIVKELSQLTNQLPSVAYSALLLLNKPAFIRAADYYKSYSSRVQAQCGGKEASDQCLPLLTGLLDSELTEPNPADWQPRANLKRHKASQNLHAPESDQHPSEGDTAELVVDWDADLEFDTLTDTQEAEEGQPAVDKGDTTDSLPPGTEASAPPDSTDPAYRLIDNTSYRNALLADIAELQAFLRQRSAEVSSTSFIGLSATVSEGMPEVSTSDVDTMAAAVQDSWLAMTSESFTRLLGLHGSPKFFARLAGTLEVQANQEAKYFRLLKEAESKMQTIQQSLREDSAELATLISKTKKQKQLLEERVEAVLHGQKVEVTGLGKALASTS